MGLVCLIGKEAYFEHECNYFCYLVTFSPLTTLISYMKPESSKILIMKYPTYYLSKIMDNLAEDLTESVRRKLIKTCPVWHEVSVVIWKNFMDNREKWQLSSNDELASFIDRSYYNHDRAYFYTTESEIALGYCSNMQWNFFSNAPKEQEETRYYINER